MYSKVLFNHRNFLKMKNARQQRRLKYRESTWAFHFNLASRVDHCNVISTPFAVKGTQMRRDTSEHLHVHQINKGDWRIWHIEHGGTGGPSILSIQNAISSRYAGFEQWNLDPHHPRVVCTVIVCWSVKSKKKSNLKRKLNGKGEQREMMSTMQNKIVRVGFARGMQC